MPVTPDTAYPERLVATPDGIGVAVYDFGGTGPDLLFVHATGFCAGVLLPLAQKLTEGFHCWALDLRGHGRSGRPPDGDFSWSGFATDVLAVVDDVGLTHPAGFGHSCGGASLLLAEQRRPGTFRSLHLFEPVVLPASPAPLDIADNPMSNGARRRRDTFPSPDDAFLNFSSKPPFADLDPDVLRHYVEDGFEPIPAEAGGDGVAIRLRCRKDDEAVIYQHGLNNGAFEQLGMVRCPTTFAYGSATDAFGERLMRSDAKRMEQATVEAVDGLGHFGPLQRPDLVAEGVWRSATPSAGTPRP